MDVTHQKSYFQTVFRIISLCLWERWSGGEHDFHHPTYPLPAPSLNQKWRHSRCISCLNPRATRAAWWGERRFASLLIVCEDKVLAKRVSSHHTVRGGLDKQDVYFKRRNWREMSRLVSGAHLSPTCWQSKDSSFFQIFGSRHIAFRPFLPPKECLNLLYNLQIFNIIYIIKVKYI